MLARLRAHRATARSPRPVPHARDAGFTLVEVVVSIGLISLVMTSLGAFFVSSMVTTSAQSARQVAVQLATDAMERVRAHDPGDLASALPSTPQAVEVNGIPYEQAYAVAECWQAAAGGDCGPTVPGGVRFLRVTVEVTWPQRSCPASGCSYEAVTLVNPTAAAPIFNTAPPPVVDNPGDQTWTVDVPLSPPLQLGVTGGAAGLTWSATGTPDGLVFDAASGRFTGTPGTATTYTVTVTARDGLGRVGTATFQWIIAEGLTLADPGPQVSAAGVPVDLALVHAGGSGELAWAATGLPAGLAINAKTGRVTGTATDVGAREVTVTVTDKPGGRASVRFTWTVAQPIRPGDRVEDNQTVRIAPSVVVVGSGTAPYRSWASVGLPEGLALDQRTGLITGTPTQIRNHQVTVTAVDSRGRTVTAEFDWMIKND